MYSLRDVCGGGAEKRRGRSGELGDKVEHCMKTRNVLTAAALIENREQTEMTHSWEQANKLIVTLCSSRLSVQDIAGAFK